MVQYLKGRGHMARALRDRQRRRQEFEAEVGACAVAVGDRIGLGLRLSPKRSRAEPADSRLDD